MVAAAIVGAAVVGAAGSAAAGSAQSKAARSATDAQVQASDAALQLDREIYQDQRQLLAPSARAGAEARARQMLMLGYTPEQVRAYLTETNAALARPVGSLGYGVSGAANSGVQDDYSWVDEYDPEAYLQSTPGYGFRLSEGQKALERSAAARGNLFSGQTGQALTEYGQDYATGEWDNLFRQFGAIAGDGSDATGTIVQVGGQFGDSAGANIRAAGNARASGYRAIGDANAAEYQGYADAIGGALGAWGSYGGFTSARPSYSSGRSGSGWYS